MQYLVTIGLEIHVQLNTKTKIFCSCATSFGDRENSHVCPTCLALPGALPVLNHAVLNKAIAAGIALNCQIQKEHRFDRKNYFYPDLPKAYQISQFELPYCKNGHLVIHPENQAERKIGITRIHMEEDAGKLVHPDGQSSESYVDLNRAGTPLIEIVSEPELESSTEAYYYLKEIKKILEYLNVSDCNMEMGSLRCDANVSIRKNKSDKLGTRAEIKNLNSFKNVRAAIDFEVERQADELEAGNKIIQETRLWDADREETRSMRGKEESHDYRYFPDPDLVTLTISDEMISTIKNNLAELPSDRLQRFISELSLSTFDAENLTSDKETADYFEEVISIKNIPPKKAANWILSEMLRETSIKNCSLHELIAPALLAKLILLIESGTISGKIAKSVFQEMIHSKKDPEVIITEKGLTQISDESEIQKFIDEVIESNQESVASFKNGKEKALGFLVGQVMKKSKGKANPQAVNKLLLNQLKK